MSAGIYTIQNLINQKVYIGSAINLTFRRYKHFTKLKCNIHFNRYLQNAWNKYGKENFCFWVIEGVVDKNYLIEREQFYLDLFRSYSFGIYNICFVPASHLGIKYNLSEEAKRKMSLSHKARFIGAV